MIVRIGAVPQRAQGVAPGPLESMGGPGVGPIGSGDQPPIGIDMATSGLVVQGTSSVNGPGSRHSHHGIYVMTSGDERSGRCGSGKVTLRHADELLQKDEQQR
jgi:hypothetical protein